MEEIMELLNELSGNMDREEYYELLQNIADEANSRLDAMDEE